MKYLLCIALLAVSIPQEQKLTGTYRIEFLKKDGTNAYKIELQEDKFRKIMPDASTKSGKITYSKYTAMLKNDADDPIEVDLRDAGKDTLHFKLRNRNNASMKINEGLLIRVK